jgi:hypothetical protein
MFPDITPSVLDPRVFESPGWIEAMSVVQAYLARGHTMLSLDTLKARMQDANEGLERQNPMNRHRLETMRADKSICIGIVTKIVKLQTEWRITMADPTAEIHNVTFHAIVSDA